MAGSKRGPGAGSVIMIDDDKVMARAAGDYLEIQQYCVDYAYDGITGFHLAEINEYDAIILDGSMPGMDGLEVCRRLRRENKSSAPIIMLTGRSSLDEKVRAFEAGADDYLCKPFDLRELNGRLKALIRRARQQVSRSVLRVADLEFDTGTLTVRRAGQLLELTPVAMRILGVLMRESPRLVARQRIEHEVWGDELPDSDTLRSHLYVLRCAIDRPFGNPLLHTVASYGYRLCDLSAEGVAAVQH
ncbi:DNA-binding response regulator, OmpR family, contains REC and winged-helix (wHTH) domain [Dyella jiangningensis]|uniref:response regulator transcription factor n=1 Tax=Dyella sp. AtDHG13 TaxID=1938897 RepID=UPI00088AC8CB|nr:response regulator transcription factor [Dyella sp. AtDHG13]PXV55831.1 DNA-binding response OmpR family regulator [Dyella sp. AtDHG13]SDK54859.1 DNA-binding response regulator, OmpR family, contains REC and winged-helix (wHTH) domain [Dyella jiangningensis]